MDNQETQNENKTETKTTLKLLLWNANGIRPKEYEFAKTDRVDKGGGSAILIEDINHQSIGAPSDCASVIIPNNSEDICITAMYCHPGCNTIQEKLDFSMQQAPNFVIRGDFNSKHPAGGNKATNKNGKLMNSRRPEEPTFYPGNYRQTPDILDMILTYTNYVAGMVVEQKLGSDHLPKSVSLAIPTKKETFRRTNREVDWEKFKENMAELYPTILTDNMEDID
ncbi:hypothetical protein PR048_005303 [Dryococelus australis]|uniref:Endonuclease/exonuclease/phosphatase domain-containing protein n=1 Tax=Dryococelus australis TaxID=614101 RepID=A0ABQ9I7U4_9NEOP|nr:hypothetical protein PR048_005303 [Dryococelus australis]